MRLATPKQLDRLDRELESRYLIPTEVLMETAGVLAAHEISNLCFLERLSQSQVLVVSGTGGNGADGLVIARHLHSLGFKNLKALLCSTSKASRGPSDLFHRQLSRLEKRNLEHSWWDGSQIAWLKESAVIVDALLGTGFNGELTGETLQLVRAINNAAKIISIDVPSGLNAERGSVSPEAVCADRTLTLGLAKNGFFSGLGPDHIGHLKVLSLGFPPELLRSVADTHFLFDEKSARRALRRYQKKERRVNKYSFGRCLVIAGSDSMLGAGILSAKACARIGAGHVTWAPVLDEPISRTEIDELLKAMTLAPEILTAQLTELLEKDLFGQFQSIVIGPGVGLSTKTQDLIAKVIRRLKESNAKAVVLDADALTICSQEKLFPVAETWVLTPHAGELARIHRIDVQEITNDRERIVHEAQAKTGGILLLKGPHSLVHDGRRFDVIASGNSALAKAGTGDVLSGFIAGLISQGFPSEVATCLAAYLHGRIADDWCRAGNHSRALLASDLIDAVSKLMNELS